MAGFLCDKGLGDSHGTVHVLVSGRPYPPCTVPVNQLTHVSFPIFVLIRFIEGSILMLQRTSHVVKLRTHSWNVVRDHISGQRERLEIHLHQPCRNEENIWESAHDFAIKDHYFTLNNDEEAVPWISHPSDLVNLTNIDDCDVSQKSYITCLSSPFGVERYHVPTTDS